MPKPRLTIEQQLTAAQVAIDNARAEAEIKTALAEVGYDDMRLQQGRALYERALALHQRQRAEYGEQYAASEALTAAWEQAETSYIRCIKIARVALKNDRGAAQQLDLNGQRKQSLSGWLVQARQFYANALSAPDILAKLEPYGLTRAKLEAGQAEVGAVEAANLAQQKERGEAQTATKARDAALDELNEWMSDFVALARVALDEQPQRLEKLGVVARS